MAPPTAVGWSDLPHKSQLVVLALCRFAEPLTNVSILSYLYYLLQSLDPGASPGTLSQRAGYVAVSFALGQFCTGASWGRLSDSKGRKVVILVGTSGTILSALSLAFATRIEHVVVARFAAGLLNGNVGVMRTMVGEIVPKGTARARAFLILPMCFNIGSIIGPMLGVLADPMKEDSSLYWLVGRNSLLGGAEGSKWLRRHPYALPNLACAVFLATSFSLAWLFLHETLPTKRNQPDFGLRIGRFLTRFICCRRASARTVTYQPVPGMDLGELSPTGTASSVGEEDIDRPRPPLRQVLKGNVAWTLASFTLLPLHMAAFIYMWPIYLSMPRATVPTATGSSSWTSSLFLFDGGLGFSAATTGYAISIAGCVGIVLQLLVFPPIQARFDTLPCYRFAMPVFCIGYFLAPFLSWLDQRTHLPASSHRGGGGGTSPMVWAALILVVTLLVGARTFAGPCNVVLLNDSCPDRLVLGTVHGIGHSLSSLSRVLGPLASSALLAYGDAHGVIGVAWWAMAATAGVGTYIATRLRDGSKSQP